MTVLPVRLVLELSVTCYHSATSASATSISAPSDSIVRARTSKVSASSESATSTSITELQIVGDLMLSNMSEGSTKRD